MLRDAFNGKLIDIPPSVLAADIVSDDMWKFTRLVMSEDVNTHADRSKCLGLIVQGLVDVAVEQGASQLITLLTLSTLLLVRALRQRGFDAERIGESYLNEGDGRRYAVLSMPAKRTMPHMPRATHRIQPQSLHAPAV
jgi:acyl homoserine lactone synthase